MSFGQGEKPKVSSRIELERVASGRMTPAERYILLGLRLGRHVDGLVDSYYGPAELSEQAETEELVPPEQLAADGAALVAELEDGWLRDCAYGLETYARVLSGEEISYSDEVERCYGVRPSRIDPRRLRGGARARSRSCCRATGRSPSGARRGASGTACRRTG